jgi:hypothetical protein
MLKPETYDSINNPLDTILRATEMAIITSIAEHLHTYGRLIETDIYRIGVMNEVQIVERDIKKTLSTMTKKSLTEIDRIFDRAAIESDSVHDADYLRRGIEHVPYSDNAVMRRMVAGYAEITKNAFKSLTRSAGFIDKQGNLLPPHEFFNRTISQAAVNVAVGAFTYDQEIKRAVKELAASGLRTSVVIGPDGKPVQRGGVQYPHMKRPMEVVAAVRMNVLTGIGQLTQEIEFMNGEELGMNLVETTAHATARETHQPWQGRRFSFDGTIPELKRRIEQIRDDDKGQRLVSQSLK